MNGFSYFFRSNPKEIIKRHERKFTARVAEQLNSQNGFDLPVLSNDMNGHMKSYTYTRGSPGNYIRAVGFSVFSFLLPLSP